MRPFLGETVGDFLVTTVDGDSFDRDDLLPQDTWIAFLSADCAPCRQKLPAFAEHIRALPAGETRPVAIILGDPGDTAPFTDALRPLTKVVADDDAAEIAALMAVTAFPSFVRVGPGAPGELTVKENNPRFI
ncbi:hypothetical protein GCM10010468_30660 [Actinocorallia longicatena]|uniref:Thioredoxin domain-containing protein n=1 Tax=Actinocorallia longicatena TaxID=111803 RepID=A0ABP6Q979_9ACTN